MDQFLLLEIFLFPVDKQPNCHNNKSILIHCHQLLYDDFRSIIVRCISWPFENELREKNEIIFFNLNFFFTWFSNNKVMMMMYACEATMCVSVCVIKYMTKWLLTIASWWNFQFILFRFTTIIIIFIYNRWIDG